MALQYYDKGYVYADGQLLGESSGGSIEYQGDPQPVSTLTKDLAGFTPIPQSATVSIDGFVPTKGFQFDAIKKYLDKTFVDVKLQFGGSGIVMKAQGIVMGPSISFSATVMRKW